MILISYLTQLLICYLQIESSHAKKTSLAFEQIKTSGVDKDAKRNIRERAGMSSG